MNCNTLSIFAVLCSSIASMSLISFSHLIIAASHSIPHSWIFGSWENSSTIIIEGIVVHILKLISLPKSIPSSEIFRVNFYCISIGLYSSRNIFHLKILMTHESPSSKASSIKFKSLPKIDNSFKMFSHKWIVISNNTTCFRNIFIIIKLF